ncbi:MAG: EAL domain-containing protein [Proteobacteria bacterium]|nr:EAL domain-containing protein [Pseudomonadota bacterium]NOG59670.1 EAL domain-containing protein [Pseudomonadota bacterium]
MPIQLKKINLSTRLRRKIMTPVVICFLMIISLIILGINFLQNTTEVIFLESAKQNIANTFQIAVKKDVQLQQGLIELIQSNNDIQRAWKNRDRDLLLSLTKPIFDYVQSEHNITHFYFHDLDKVNFLKLHLPEHYGNKINRYTIQQAYDTGLGSSGLEYGVMNNFILRVVQPWSIDGELVGYIELGEEINHLIDKVAEIHNCQITLVADKKFIKNIDIQKNATFKRIIEETVSPDSSFIMYSTHDEFNGVLQNYQYINESEKNGFSNIFQSGDHKYFSSSFNITDVNQQHVGHMIYSIDITELEEKKAFLLRILLTTIFIVTALILFFYYKYSGKLQRFLSNIFNRLEQEIESRAKTEEKLESYTKKLEKIVDERTNELIKINDELKRDIELRKKTEVEFRKSERKYRVLFEKTSDAILIIDNNNFVDCNEATVNMLRYNSKEELLMTHPSQLSPLLQPDGRESWEKAEEMIAMAYENGSHRFEWEHKRADGEVFPVEVLLTSIPVGEKNILYTVWRDITERKRDEGTIRHQAYYDSLTNLPNRALLRDRLHQEIIHAKRQKKHGAVMFLDLDQFKKINDSLGHSIGDSLLIEVSNRINGLLREGDTAARFGGDEFVILLSGLAANDTSFTYAEKVAEKIKSAINVPFNIDHYELKISVSIGISVYKGKDESVDDVLRHADTAMYRAKSDGRNMIRFFLPSMQAEVIKRLNMEKDLRDAFENRELYLCYQPQYTAENKLYGVEALLRWKHPTQGHISPLDFIPVAEEIGLIIPISEWVLNQAMADISSIDYLSRNQTPMHLSINLSPYQFRQDDFILNIKKAIVNNDFPTKLLTLEITENVIIDNIEDTVQKCKQLSELDIKISLDDFGTGYSSLSYLKQLPINELKIDKSFVQDIEKDINDATLVQTIISMAHHFNLKIVAEGVETIDQQNFLLKHNCDAFQGYYFSKPVTIEEVKSLHIKYCEKSKSA